MLSGILDYCHGLLINKILTKLMVLVINNMFHAQTTDYSLSTDMSSDLCNYASPLTSFENLYLLVVPSHH